MRIISGKFKGRKLDGFSIDGTRPTMDRVKESIFGMIQDKVKNAIVLDLFAGSGSLGLEAISSGACEAYLIDNNSLAINAIKKNSINMDNVYVIHSDWKKYLSTCQMQFDIIFLDPPYDLMLINESIELILNNKLLKESGIIVCEYESEVIKTCLNETKERNMVQLTYLFIEVKMKKLTKENIYDYLDEISIILKNKYSFSTLNMLKKQYNMDFNQMFEYFSTHRLPIDYNSVAIRLIRMNQQDVVIKYLDYFISNNNRLLELKYFFDDFNIDVSKINNYIDTYPNVIINEIASKSNKPLNNSDIGYQFLKELVSELVQVEQIKYSEIEFIDSGSASSVYQIGTKVLKIGLKRNNFNIKNHKLFLKPLIRREIYSNNQFVFCIEVTDRVDTSNITEEDAYIIYRQLRDEGYVWTDASPSNVGRLIRINKANFNGITRVDKANTGYLDDNFEVLKPGNLVLLDNEYIYDYEKYKNDSRIITYLKNSDYEYRYQEEANYRMII